ncbi:hypothetical protein ADUPG1_011264, partial [Aduncisulcus paluster]
RGLQSARIVERFTAQGSALYNAALPTIVATAAVFSSTVQQLFLTGLYLRTVESLAGCGRPCCRSTDVEEGCETSSVLSWPFPNYSTHHLNTSHSSPGRNMVEGRYTNPLRIPAPDLTIIRSTKEGQQGPENCSRPQRAECEATTHPIYSESCPAGPRTLSTPSMDVQARSQVGLLPAENVRERLETFGGGDRRDIVRFHLSSFRRETRPVRLPDGHGDGYQTLPGSRLVGNRILRRFPFLFHVTNRCTLPDAEGGGLSRISRDDFQPGQDSRPNAEGRIPGIGDEHRGNVTRPLGREDSDTQEVTPGSIPRSRSSSSRKVELRWKDRPMDGVGDERRLLSQIRNKETGHGIMAFASQRRILSTQSGYSRPHHHDGRIIRRDRDRDTRTRNGDGTTLLAGGGRRTTYYSSGTPGSPKGIAEDHHSRHDHHLGHRRYYGQKCRHKGFSGSDTPRDFTKVLKAYACFKFIK